MVDREARDATIVGEQSATRDDGESSNSSISESTTKEFGNRQEDQRGIRGEKS